MDTRRHLFGGAVALRLDEALADVSALRDVPDNQEVFAAAPAAAGAPSPLSLVVEVLERVGSDEATSDAQAAAFLWRNLAEENGAEEARLDGNGGVESGHR